MNNSGVRRWLISCDESGVHGSAHYGFGSLWMKWQRRGDFSEAIKEFRQLHNYNHEIKWNRVNSVRALPFYKDLIEYFFRRRWLVFHCLVVRKDVVKKEFHDNDWDLARRKHYTLLLTNKMRKALNRYPNRDHEFRVHIDKMASRYAKADEAMEVISNNILNSKFRKTSPVKSVISHDSKNHAGIQLCDLLLGAVMEAWQKSSQHEAKKLVRGYVAEHLGWKNLDSDTYKHERKFNIWYFTDTTREKRRVKTKKVELRYPYPTYTG